MDSLHPGSSRTNRPPLRHVTTDKSSQDPIKDDVKFEKGVSPKINFPVPGLSTKGSPAVKDLFSSRLEKTLSKVSKIKSSCRNQGDGVKKDHSGHSRMGNTGDGGAEPNKNDDISVLSKRAVVRCSNDWEDTLPIATLAMCENVMPEFELDKGSVEEPPKSINEIFNHIIHYLVANEEASPLKRSSSTPQYFGTLDCPIDKNMNREDGLASDIGDKNDGGNNPSTIRCKSKRDGSTAHAQAKCHSSSSSDNVSHPLTNDSCTDDSLNFETIDISSDLEENETARGKRADSSGSMYSVFRRARRMTRKAILTVRSRSPTPQSMREAFSSVVQTGKTIIQKSKDAIVAASCVIPDSDDEDAFLTSQENIELGFVSHALEEPDLKIDDKRNAKSLHGLDNESLKPLASAQELKAEEDIESDEAATKMKSFLLGSVPDDKSILNNSRCVLSEIMREDNSKMKTTVDLTESDYKHDNAMEANNPTCRTNFGHRKKGHVNEDECFVCGHSDKKCYAADEEEDDDNGNIIHDATHSFGNSQTKKEFERIDVDCVVKELGESTKYLLNRPVANLKFPFHDGDEKIVFTSSMSDVPFDESTGSDDLPRKTISLVTSNEADQDRDITEVMALISDEASLKRYASVHDLTDLQHEGDRSTSLSFTSNGNNRRLKLNERVFQPEKHVVKEANESPDNNIAASVEHESDKGDAEIESRDVIVNVLDPSYDTDDDQRSSDLSSCDDILTDSSSQKRTTTSSLTTPPNSPRVGIQADAVSTIISLFETNSILCASATCEEDLARHANYRELNNQEVSDCFVDKMVDGWLLDGIKDNVKEEILHKDYQSGKMSEKLDCGRKEVLDEKNARSSENELEGSSLDIDIEQLVAALPSPPNTDIQEIVFSEENTTNHGASTSMDYINNDYSADFNFALLRKAFQQEVKSAEIGDVLGESLQEQQNREKQEPDDIKKCGEIVPQLSEAGEKEQVECIADEGVKSAPQWSNERDDSDVVCVDDTVHIKGEPEDVSVPESSIVNQSNTMDNLDLSCLEKRRDLSLNDSDANNLSEKNEIQDPVDTCVKPVSADIDPDIETIKDNELGNVIDETESHGKDNHVGNNLETKIKMPICEDDSKIDAVVKANRNLSDVKGLEDHHCVDPEKQRTNQTKHKLENDIPRSLTLSDIEVDYEIPAVKLKESNIADNLRFSVGSSKDTTSTVSEAEMCKKSTFVDNNACSSYSAVCESSQTLLDPESIHPILLPRKVTPNLNRPPRPAKITWALEQEREATPSLSLSEGDDEKEGDDTEKDLNPFNRCNSCSPKQPNPFNRCNSCLPKQPNPFNQITNQAEDTGMISIKDDVLVGNSSRMAQFILYTGALFPSLSTKTHHNEFAVTAGPDVAKNSPNTHDIDKRILRLISEEENFLDIKSFAGKGDVLDHQFPANENVNSDHIDFSRAEDGDKVANSSKDKWATKIESNGSAAKIISPAISPLLKPIKKVTNAMLTQSICAFPIKKNSSLDSAIQRNQRLWAKGSLSQGALDNQAPSLRLIKQCSPYLPAQETPKSCASFSQMANALETTSNFLDRMNERIELSLGGINKTHRFIDRTQEHLNRCDVLIDRTTATLQKSAQISAAVREQVNRVDHFLASGRLNSPQRTTRK